MTIFDLLSSISEGRLEDLFSCIYRKSDSERLRQRARYLNAADIFSRAFPNCDDICVFSASARVKICGNHTSVHGGNALVTAVSADILAIVGYNDEGLVRIKTDKSDIMSIDISNKSDIAENSDEFNRIVTVKLADFAKRGTLFKGADIYISSDIPKNCGFSLSDTLDELISAIIIFSENKDINENMTAKNDGLSIINKNFEQNIKYDLSESGYTLCIVNTDKATNISFELNSDLNSAAKAMGVDYLYDVDVESFYQKLPEIRLQCSDRAVFSGLNFFAENRYVDLAKEALESGKLNDFFSIANKSAETYKNIYNTYECNNCENLTMAAVSNHILNDAGIVRIDENGRIQAYVPNYMVAGYAAEMERIFGINCVQTLGFRTNKMIIMRDVNV